MRLRRHFIALLLLSAPAPTVDASELALAGGEKAVVAATAQRAMVLRRALAANREWSGGHSPVPRRAIAMNAIRRVSALLTSDDASALVELMLDDAYDVRSAAARLIADLTPEAETLTRRRLDRTVEAKQRRRLEAALIDISMIRASR